MQKTLGWIMLFAGVFILFVGYAFPMVMVVVDTTPPEWGVTSDGVTLALCPKDGDVLQKCGKIQARVKDPESGVSSVTAWIDGTQYDLPLSIGTIYSGVWQMGITPITTSGTYTINYTAINKAGLSRTYSGSFQIYTGLQGEWYVNGIEITESTQTIYSTVTTINFTFVKTAGIEDSEITCKVMEGATTHLTLNNTASSTWTGSKVFPNGRYDLQLQASDGTNTIIMAVIGMQVGPESFQLPQVNMLQIFGLASIAIGTLLVFTGKKH